MSIETKIQISAWSNREKIPKFTKYKDKSAGCHLVNEKPKKLYDYYVCDYCKNEIVIKDKKEQQDGGIAILPNSLTYRGEIQVALHNKCLKHLVKELERERWGD